MQSTSKKAALAVGACVVVFGLIYLGSLQHNAGEKAVLQHLNDPESARFGDSFQSTRDKSAWCGTVNAKNRMGGYVGATRYVARVGIYSGISDVAFEDDSENSVFPGRWKTYCE